MLTSLPKFGRADKTGRTARPARCRRLPQAAEVLEDRVVLSATGWFQGLGGPARTVAADTAVDAAGNQVVLGGFGQGTLDLDGAGTGDTWANAETANDGYLAKYDPSGNLLWSRQLAAGDNVVDGTTVKGVVWADFGGTTIDARGNTYLLATFSGRLDFVSRDAAGNTCIDATLTAPVGNNTTGIANEAFLAKYAPDGSLVWARNFGGQDSGVLCQDIAVDDLDANEANWSIYAVGRNQHAADFDPGAGTAFRQYSGGFLAKYSAADGAYKWIRQVTSPYGANGFLAPYYGVAVDANGVYAGGLFAGSAIVEGGAARSVTVSLSGTGSDGLLTSYTHDGDLRWTQRIGGAGEQIIESIAVANGAVYATGSFVGTADFDLSHEDKRNRAKDDLASAGGRDGFVAKYAATGDRRTAGGQLTWAKRFGGTGDDYGFAIAADAATNKLAVGGTFRKSMNFGGDLPALSTPDPATANPDAFAALLSDAGTSAKLTDAWRMGGSGATGSATSMAEAVTGIAFDPRGTGALSVVGNFGAPTADFPNGQTLTLTGQSTAFVGRFAPSAAPAITGVAAEDDTPVVLDESLLDELLAT
jgi:hypothetical protein